MPLTIMPPSKNASAKALVGVFERAEKKLIAEITRKRAQGYVDYAEVARLKRIREILQEMVDESAGYIPSAVEYEFYKGGKHRAGYRNAEAVSMTEREFAIEQLQDNLLGQVQEMAGTAYQSAVSKLALLGRTESDIFREVGLTQAIESMAVGRGAMTTTEEVIRSLNEAGITAFVDKAGREWSLRSYGNMAVRTTVRQAQVSALLTEDDHDLYQVIWHYAPCRLCATYAGRVYSKSGKNPNYPPLAMAFGKIDPAGPNELSNTFLNIHPQCLCSLARYTEAGKTEKQIEQMRERSSFEKHPADVDPRSKREIEAYRTKERNRAKLLAEQKQWMRYKEAGVPGVPQTFQTFQKHKRLDDEKYREWLAGYRKAEKPKIEKPKPTSPKVFVSQFKPAESVADAEKYAERFTDKNGFGALGVSYKGVDLEIANKVNKTLGDFYDEFDVPKFGGVVAPAGNTKLGKQIASATAAYSPIRNSFILNRNSMKNMKTFNVAVSKETEAIKSVLAHPERYDIDRMSKRVRDVIFNSKISGRGTVPETVEDVINHELGHSLERALKGLPNYEALKSGMPQFATKVSGYAADSFSEYVAESFASYRKGEKLIDPEMVRAFEMLKRK